MGDQAALQEAIQRARQLAAKISQNAPVKRSASELDDHRDIGTVKVTLAYEKPANSDSNKQQQQQQSEHRDHHHRSNSRDHRDNNNYSSTKESLLYPQTNRGDRERDGGDRSREKDRDYDRESNYPSGGGNSNSVSSNNAYTRSGNNNNNNSQISTGYGSMLSGANSYSSNPADERIEIIIPHAVIGLVIGKGGENIKRIQNETGATVRVDPNTVDEKGNKVCTIVGTKQAVEEAHNQVSSVIENAATNKRPRMQTEGSEQYRMKIPASRTGAIIGKGGETIKSIKLQSGCDIELDKGSKDSGSDESIFIIRGTQDKILKARAMIESRLASRGRDGDNRDIGGRPNAGPKGVATGANAAPVAQFTDLPASYPAAGQQTSADVSAAWAAYFAQYSSLLTQAGAQPGAPAMPYAGQNMMGSQQVTDQQQSLQQPTAQAAAVPGGQQQDYSDQWIEFYMMNGRPDYAEQIIEMKKQQQAQKQQQQQQPPQ